MSSNPEQCKRAVEAYRSGKSWVVAARESGLSEAIGRIGPTAARKTVKAIDLAFTEVVKRSPNKPDELKAISIDRLVNDIQNGKSSGVAREIETLGKFKEHDWFVRNADVAIGIFPVLAEGSDSAAEAIDVYAKQE